MSNNLKFYRLKQNLTQKEVADFIGVAQNTYSNWECGKAKINPYGIKKLSKLFKVSGTALFADFEKINKFYNNIKKADIDIDFIMDLPKNFKIFFLKQTHDLIKNIKDFSNT